jgi:HPt (histidine-containing phosphotransfer) domain-containing protein
MGRVGLHIGKQLTQALKWVRLQSVQQGIHAVIIPCVNPPPHFSWLDLHRLSDYALDAADLRPLMQTLADDLAHQTMALNQALTRGEDAQTLHRLLHALKGMAGMFAVPALYEALTLADDACRQGQHELGEPRARAVLPSLGLWLAEVRAWLHRYS